ncbi:retrotransposon gag protein [Penicillium sp. DV-2018c]|nr:retrotransposon gag protein [Penicillium sp. DV-2018c]
MDPQDHQAPPPWLQALMQQIEEGRQEQQQRANDQEARIHHLEEMLMQHAVGTFAHANAAEPTVEAAAPPTVEPATEPTQEPISTASRRVRPRPRLPDPPLFGGNVNDWPTWRITMENKLTVDGEAIGSRHAQFMYIFSRLEKLAWKNTGTFVKHRRSEGSPEEILEYLERIYGDPNAQARAARKLHQMKQPDGVSFPRFLPRLEKEFADAGAINWHDQARRQILLGSLNKTMSAALMNRGIPNTYSELNGRKSTRRGKFTDEMDWEPTVSANKVRPRENRNRATNGKRAKWVAEEEITRRREEGLCLRCGEEDHFVSNCPYRPAERPSSSRVALGQTKKGRAVSEMARRRSRGKTAEMDDDSSGEETPSESGSDSENE